MNRYRFFEAREDRAPKSNRFCPFCDAGLPQNAGTESGRSVCPSCGYTGYRNPLPGVVLVIARADGCVLVGRRGPGSFRGGMWCLPGGFIEEGEDFVEEGLREAKEETGLDVGISGILGVVSNAHSDGHHSLVVVLLARAGGANPDFEVKAGAVATPGDDMDELVWVAPGELLPEMAFGADIEAIETWRSGSAPLLPLSPRISGGAQEAGKPLDGPASPRLPSQP